MPRRKVRILLVPFDSGLRDTRMGSGPQAILDAGLDDRLAANGLDVRTSVVERPEELFPSETAVAFALQRAVSAHVARARREDAFPLVLSGNCNSAVGTVSGMRATGITEPAVVWLDAHADFNTPETTSSGFLDGMALAMLTGRCWATMTQSVPGFRAVPTPHVLLLGARDVDPFEESLLRECNVTRLAAADLAEQLSRALSAFPPALREAYVHIDLDVLDPSEGRANGFAAPGGLTTGTLREAVRQIGEHFHIGGAALTAYDPSCDPERRVAVLACELAVLLTVGATEP